MRDNMEPLEWASDGPKKDTGGIVATRSISGVTATGEETHYDRTLRLFLHVNRRGLNVFQAGILQKVMKSGAGVGTLRAALADLALHKKTLMDADWKPAKDGSDPVLKPTHYDRLPMEPTYFLGECGERPHWCLENFLKYVTRYPFKNGVEDLGKAQRNLDMYIKYLLGEPGWSL